MKKILALLAVTSVLNAHAYVENFTFAAHSDAGRLYTCGASIKEGYTGHSATISGSGEHTYNGGDFMVINGSAISANSNGGGAGGWATFGVVPSQAGAINFGNGQAIDTNTVSMMLGSEKMSSSYQIVVCYDAPTFSTGEANSTYVTDWEDVDYSAKVLAEVTATTLGTDEDGAANVQEYAKQAGLKVQTDWHCNGVRMPENGYAGGESYDGMNPGLPRFDATTIHSTASASAQDAWFFNDSQQILFTKCTLTYTFTETSNALRLHDQSVAIRLFSELNRFD